jgi:organic hydroperoxide reductase OsmC/OhrA
VTYVLDSTEGHWQIISAELDVRGRIENLDDEDFARAAADAAETCVVSKAVSGNVRITTRSRLLR